MAPDIQSRLIRELRIFPRRAHKRPAPDSEVLNPTVRVRASLLLRRYGLLIAWAFLIAVFGALRPSTFLTVGNFQGIFGSQSVLLILTIALLFPMIAGEFDLSITGVFSVALVTIGWLNVQHGWPIGWTIVVAFAFGIGAGIANAVFVIAIGVPSIIVTLGMGTLLTGVGIAMNDLTVAGLPPGLITSMSHQVLGLPAGFYYGLFLTALAWYVLTFTPFGRYVYLVGAAREVARVSGIRVDAVRAISLLTSSIVSTFAAVVFAGIVGASDPNVGATYLLPAFAAVFLGATTISVGRFNAWGSLVAIYFLVTGITGLEFLGFSGWIEQVFYGGSLVLAVAFARLSELSSPGTEA